jgi:hypothetical protein
MAERRMYQRLALLALQRYLKDVYPEKNVTSNSVSPETREGEKPPDVYVTFVAAVNGEDFTIQVFDSEEFVSVLGNTWKCYSYDIHNNLKELEE